MVRSGNRHAEGLTHGPQAAPHDPARSLGHPRLQRGRRAGRMGRHRLLPVLGHGCGGPDRQSSRGFPSRVHQRAVLRVLDPRGGHGSPAPTSATMRSRLWRSSSLPGLAPRASMRHGRRRRRRSRSPRPCASTRSTPFSPCTERSRAARSRSSSARLHVRDHGPDGADRLHAHARAFEFVESDDEPGERIDLFGMMGAKNP